MRVAQLRAAGEGAARAARQAPRAHRPRYPIPPALPRPDRRRGRPARFRDPLAGDRDDARGAARTRLPRGRDAGAAEPGRRRRGAAVHHPPQRARPRHVPADRARAAPQAADRRRHGPGVRDRPRLPQRGPRHPPQPRVHDARGLPGVRRLPRHDGAHRGDRRAPRHRGERDDGRQRRRARGRPGAAVAAGDDGRADQGERRGRDASRRCRSTRRAPVADELGVAYARPSGARARSWPRSTTQLASRS